ncbi:MAG: hypothetical protein Q9213_001836 [Squamulea squamosa]
MDFTQLRGGTPVEYEPNVAIYQVTDPHILSQLGQLNRMSRKRLAEHTQEAVERARAEYVYHPPPHMREPDSEDEQLPYDGLPSPASSPPHDHASSMSFVLQTIEEQSQGSATNICPPDDRSAPLTTPQDQILVNSANRKQILHSSTIRTFSDCDTASQPLNETSVNS